MAYDWKTFGITIAFDLIITLFCLLLFSRLRETKAYCRFYAPRRYVKNPGYERPSPLPSGGVAWIRRLFEYTEDEVLSIAGYDGLMYLRIFNFGVHLFTVLSLVLLASVLPANWMGDLVDENQEKRRRDEEAGRDSEEVENTEFDKVTMANVKDESNVLWVHLCACWFVTLFTLWLLLKYHRKAVDLRIEYLSTTKKGAESHTIFVRDLPGIRFGQPTDRLLNSWIFKFLPGAVKNRIQTSLDTMTNLAAGGLSRIGTSVSTVLSHPVMSGPEMQPLRGPSTGPDSTPFVRVRAKDITDMDPQKWVIRRLQDLTPDQVIELMFREVFPEGEVTAAYVVRNTSTLEPLVAKLDKAVQKLEDNLDQYARTIESGGEINIKKIRIIPLTEGKWAVEKYGQKPVKVDLLEILLLRIENLKKSILEEQEKAMGEITGSAFVGFNSRWSQVVGSSSFFHHFEGFWNAEAAPNPEEVVWENLKWRTWEQSMRTVTVWFAFVMLCLFFMVPVGAIQALIQVDRLEDVAVLGDIVTFPLVNSILVAVLPQLVLTIFLAILPMILAMMNKYQGFISESTIDFEVTRKYFIFQLIIVFLANFGILSVTDQLDQLRDDPSSIVDILAASAVRASHFFLYYILALALVSGPIELLQIPGLVLTWLFTKLAGTQREKDRIWQEKKMTYGPVVTNHSLTLFLGVVFSVVSPVILPVTLVYFLALMCYKRYNMLYIQSEAYRSGGKLWTQVYEHVIIALIFFHLIMMGILGLKKFPYAAFLVPLPLMTIAFKLLVDRMFKRPLNLLSLRAARDLDDRDTTQQMKEDYEEKEESSVQDAYLNRCFKIDWTHIEAVCNEVPRVEEALTKPQEEGAPLIANLRISQPVEYYSSDDTEGFNDDDDDEKPQSTTEVDK